MKGCNSLSKPFFYRIRTCNIFLASALIIIFACFDGVAYSAQVELAWDGSTESDLGGYKVYYGTVSRDYDVSLNVGNWTSCTISSLEHGETYYFAVTAYNTEGSESGYSNEVSIKIGTTPLQSTMPWIPLLLLDD
jgi:fibronectin type 3 domain-containing protein